MAAAFTSSAARRALAVASRFGLAAAYATLFLISAELYPAVVRSKGLAASNYCARVGAVVSPALALLVALHVRGGCLVPLLVAGGACLAAGVIVVGLPETLGNLPPETIQVGGGRRPYVASGGVHRWRAGCGREGRLQCTFSCWCPPS